MWVWVMVRAQLLHCHAVEVSTFHLESQMGSDAPSVVQAQPMFSILRHPEGEEEESRREEGSEPRAT